MSERISKTNPEETAGQSPFSGEELLPDFDEEYTDSIKEIEEMKQEAFKEACEETDKADSLTLEDKFDLAGVLAGVKPVGLLYSTYDSDEVYHADEIEILLSDLGLSFEKQIETSEYDANAYDISFIVSLRREIIEQYLADIEQSDSDNNYSINGNYLGYPKTAVEYFDTKTSDAEDVQGHERYHMLVHNPEHIQEEFEQYEAPIMAAMEKYFPISAQRLKTEKGWPDSAE
ncbi:hypothetical protein J6X15_02230 [Candidatus Saccharibacteria bacterium]|nr:hypothetical protein [Candidatus Saccharibacteria bacterium]